MKQELGDKDFLTMYLYIKTELQPLIPEAEHNQLTANKFMWWYWTYCEVNHFVL